jgi:WD40 repeat protein
VLLEANLRGSNQEVYDIAWAPDGSLLAVGGMDGCVRIFDARECKTI